MFRPSNQTPDPTIPYNEIKLDSTEVLQLAKDKYELKPGKDWAAGYHFKLDSIDDLLVLTFFWK